MKFQSKAIVVASLAAVLAMPLAACAPQSQPQQNSGTQTQTTQKSFDANKFYVGQWRGSVEITGQTVYGTAGGNEQMLNINFKDDGTVEVVPLEKHADLLNDKGTWEGTEDQVILHLSKGDIVLKVGGKAKLTGNASDFGIADFETINFDFYG